MATVNVGSVTVVVRNLVGVARTGTVRVTSGGLEVASKVKYKLGKDGRIKVDVKLNGAGRKMLADQGTLHVTVRVSYAKPSGASALRNVSVTLKQHKT